MTSAKYSMKLGYAQRVALLPIPPPGGGPHHVAMSSEAEQATWWQGSMAILMRSGSKHLWIPPDLWVIMGYPFLGRWSIHHINTEVVLGILTRNVPWPNLDGMQKMVKACQASQYTPSSNCQWIGLRENLNRKPSIFP